MKTYLKRTAIHVKEAVNGREALERFQASRLDLVLMDIHMPEMDGRESTCAIRVFEARHGRPAVPVVALTADVLTADGASVQADGFDDYVSKPIRKDEFLRCVHRHLAGSDEVSSGGIAAARETPVSRSAGGGANRQPRSHSSAASKG